MKILVATKNKNKFAEIRNKLASIDSLELVSLLEYPDAPDVVEDGDTFEENAAKKALEIAAYAGLPAIADDSGLSVTALGGRPGVLSARYGGSGLTDRDRNILLLKEMESAAAEERSAKFVCVITLAFPDGRTRSARGECAGVITRSMKGDGGFGYDPVFFLPEFGATMAELTMAQKNRISHRGKALDRMREILETLAAS